MHSLGDEITVMIEVNEKYREMTISILKRKLPYPSFKYLKKYLICITKFLFVPFFFFLPKTLREKSTLYKLIFGIYKTLYYFNNLVFYTQDYVEITFFTF